MVWPIAYNVEIPFMGIRYVHPLKQKALSELVQLVREKYPKIEALAVFGSAVTKRCRIESDIDLVVWKEDDYRFILPPNEEYDLLFANHISRKSDIWKEIEKEGVVIYVGNSRKEIASRFEFSEYSTPKS